MKQFFFRPILCLMILAGVLVLPKAILAQQSGHSIAGHLQDASNSSLPSAVVMIKDTRISTSTDVGGNFIINGLKVGKVILVFRFIGYKVLEIPVDVKPGTNNIGVITLLETNGNLGEVAIKGTMAPSQMKAYAMKKNSSAIMEVISADAIGKLPDRNAAEAVQRVQGVAVARYHGEADQATVRGTPFAWTSTLFNGTRLPSAGVYGNRASVLDVVPSEMIQYVQVSKAITPDMEGDAIGGSINFITRTAPEHRILNVSAGGGYNNFSKDGTYNGSFVYGDRFLKNKLGVMLAGALWDRQWGTDSYDVSYNTGLSNPVQQRSINTLQFKRYMGSRQTYGTNLALEWRFNEKNKVYFRGLLDKFNDIRPVYESIIDYTSSRYQYNYRYSEYQTTLNGLEFGGENQLSNKLKLDWNVSNYVSKFFIETPNTTAENARGLPIATFRQSITGGFNGLSSDGKKYWYFDSPNGVGADPEQFVADLKNPSEVMDASKLSLQQLVIAQLDNREEDQVAQLNLTYSISDRLTFKVGGKFRHKIRDGVNQASLVFLPGAAIGIPNSPALVRLNQLEQTSFPLRGGFFKEYPGNQDAYIVDPLTKQQLFNLYGSNFLNANGFRDFSPASNATLKYNGTEDVYAGYFMADFKANDKLKIIAGLRNEYTKLELNSSRLTTSVQNGQTVNTVEPTKANNDYNAILPMIHVKYGFSDQLNLRMAYTRTFIRADFPNLIPNESINLTTNPVSITRGNPDLKATFSNNYDLMGEYFFKDVGLLSGGVFFKDISNVIFTDRSYLTENNVTSLIAQPKNLKNADLFGLEAGINKRFSFLPGFWSGFGAEFNYTYINSEVEVPRLVGTNTIIDKTQLPNQSKNLFNAILFYEKNGVMIRLAGNYRGKSIETINQQMGPDFYTWTAKNFTVDASATLTLTKRIKIFTELNNLTNEPLKTYLGDPKRPQMTEWYSQRGQVGLRWDIIK